jgi:hypothetical protein
MAEPSPGSDLIVKALLDRDDPRPVWLQAWGGVEHHRPRAEDHRGAAPGTDGRSRGQVPAFLIWEQDDTYQTTSARLGEVRDPDHHLGSVRGDRLSLEAGAARRIASLFRRGLDAGEHSSRPRAAHRALPCARKRGLSLRRRFARVPAHHPDRVAQPGISDWGGWGGRYVRVRENTWLDPVPVPEYEYPPGRWFGSTGWGRNSLRPDSTSTPEQRQEYFKPMWRWTQALQNDFAARAAWCVQSYEEANHPPVVLLAHPTDLTASPGAVVRLSALGTTDPDGDELAYHWWHYEEAGSYPGTVELTGSNDRDASFIVPAQAPHGSTIHLVCEVTDGGTRRSPAINVSWSGSTNRPPAPASPSTPRARRRSRS